MTAKKPAKKAPPKPRKRHSNGKGGPADYDGSTPLTDSRREAYVQNLLSGQYANRREAFVAAGYRHHAGNETRVYQKPDVQTRLRWLQAQVQARTLTTVEDIARQLDEDRAFARGEKAPAAAVTATMGKAKVLGLVVDRHVVGMKRIEDMNENELRALLGLLEAQRGDGA